MPAEPAQVFSGLRLPQQHSLADQIYESLRHELLHGELAPGTRMVESAIAEQLGVSRTPVREALNRLTVEGWLEARRNKGVVVAGVTAREVEERYVLREVLEGYAARQAALHLSDSEIDRLEGWCDTQELHLDDEHAAEYARLNDAFHMTILHAANNETLIAIWQQFLHPAQHHVFTLGNQEHRRTFVRDHRNLVEAIRAHAPDRAEATMRAHLHRAMQVYLEDSASS